MKIITKQKWLNALLKLVERRQIFPFLFFGRKRLKNKCWMSEGGGIKRRWIEKRQWKRKKNDDNVGVRNKKRNDKEQMREKRRSRRKEEKVKKKLNSKLLNFIQTKNKFHV